MAGLYDGVCLTFIVFGGGDEVGMLVVDVGVREDHIRLALGFGGEKKTDATLS